ncbi:nuclear cap-binding protein subunit 3 [Parasteatoda tepidariorum]|uniref:nuclear cap-binding protein subunit 3 n=1 Tax=Parasteatoda tepidariorum TaxID=114398 RepID=UPI00077FE437|nr:nuclear cap-binding protein subunit 3 [Parasteatoda tepidariorum]
MSDTGAFGKILPNLKVTIGDELSNSDNSLEAGEITEVENVKEGDEISKTEIIRKWMDTLQNPKVYSTKLGGFQTGLDLSSEVLIKKLEKRAERFGLDENSRNQITQLEIDELYKSFGYDPTNLSGNKNLRLGVIHMRGVNDMNTKEVSEYFKDYGPSSVEWINDTSCNVCWYDETSAARALLGMSQPFLIRRKSKKEDAVPDELDNGEMSKETPENETVEMSEPENGEISEAKESEQNIESEADVEMEVDKKPDGESDEDVKNLPLNIPVPPGCWRLGIPHTKAKAILLRFATRDDKKLPGAEKRSQYYMKYGNPNYGGLRGLISTSRKRKFQVARNRQVVENFSGDPEEAADREPHFSSASIDSRKRSKVPRMKMYADEEEEKKRNKRSRPALNTRDSRNIKSRLGPRYTKDELIQIGPKRSDDEDEDLEEETFSVTCKIPSRYNIWSDQAKKMAQEEEEFEERKPSKSKDTWSNQSKGIDREEEEERSSKSRGYNIWSDQARRMAQEDEELEEERSSKFRGSSRYSVHAPERSSYDRSRRNNYDYSGDLREALRSSSQRQKAPEKDLRMRIDRLKEDNPQKHRSPLCRDSD